MIRLNVSVKLWTAVAALLALCAALPAAAQTGVLTGRVTDAQTGEPLPGANVLVSGTTLGAAADANGQYRIAAVPAGRVVVVARFIGYRTDSLAVSVAAGGTAQLNFRLQPDGVVAEDVIVTGQLQGQQAAINQQRQSNTIINVVPEDRLRELPDQNAAESLGRLPGIAVQRDAGEGQKVVIRGLSPRFNAVTINGQRVPSTDGSERAVDLSVLSPDQLSGIEVVKALTPDLDADAIGGAVNFVIGRVPRGLRADARLLGGYNSQSGTVDQFRGNVALSNRFLGGAVGVGVSGNAQRADRHSDALSTDYLILREATDTEPVGIGVDDLRLARTLETRTRYGGSLTLDWGAPGHEVVLNTTYGRTDREGVRTRKRYRVGESRVEYDFADRDQTTDVFSAALRGSHRLRLGGAFPALVAEWNGASARSASRTPFLTSGRFRELSAFDAARLRPEEGPAGVTGAARNNLDATFLERFNLQRGRTDETSLSGQVDLRLDLALPGVTGFLKTGAKLRETDRSRDFTNFELRNAFQMRTPPFSDPQRFALAPSGEPLIRNFVLPGRTHERFIRGFDLGPVLDVAQLRALVFEFRNQYRINVADEVDDYEANERVGAGYVMAQLNVFRGRLMLMPGVRAERTRGRYSSFRLGAGEFDDEGRFAGEVIPVDAEQDYTSYFPMVHVRVLPTSWFDVRYAYTETIARPSFFNLVPYERIRSTERLVQRGNPNLTPTRAHNHDLFFTVFTPRAGLVTLGLFTKTLDGVDFPLLGRLDTDRTSPFYLFRIDEVVNTPERTRVRGAEAEWQTNLAWLPGPLSGLLFSVNGTYTYSRTGIPFIRITRGTDANGRPITIQTDTTRAGRLVGQPTYAANFTLGYERDGFSARLSMNLQDDASRAFGARAELDNFSDTFSRWDLALSQRFGRQLQLYLNVNNLGAPAERAFQGPGLPTAAEYFGWQGDIGLRYRL